MYKSKTLLALLLLLALVMFSIPIVSASTLILDSTSYVQGSTATAEMTITVGNEKSQSYTVNWTNSTGTMVQVDTGITPASTTVPLNEFFESFVINSSYIAIYGEEINATLIGTNLEGADGSAVVTATSLDLLIEEITISTQNFIGKTLAISAKVKNATESGIPGAVCRVDIENIGGTTVVAGVSETSNHEGDIDVDFEIDDSHFEAGVQYLADINCFCQSGDAALCASALSGASGESTAGFLIDDLGSFIINDKWYNTTGFHGDFMAGSNLYPAVYLKNEFGGKIAITDGPTRIEQDNIEWLGFNNSVKGNVTTNGQGFVTGGRAAALCLILNNTFLEEKFIKIDDVSFDDDTLEQHFFPENIDTKIPLKAADILMRTGVKNSGDEGLLERCSEEFLMPIHAIGGNDIDINFHLILEGIDQQLELESDEFNFYGHELGRTFISVVDLINLTTNFDGASASSCTDINVTTTYNYYFDNRDQYEIEYCFEVFASDVIAGCEKKLINPDNGTRQTLLSTLKIPFVEFGGLGQIDATVRRVNGFSGEVVGYIDEGTNNTFTYVENFSDSCVFGNDLDAQQRQASFLEIIANKTGTFKFSLECPTLTDNGINMKCDISAQVEDSQTVEKEVDFTCYISKDSIRYSALNFNQMITRTETKLTKEFLVPESFGDSANAIVQCEASYYNLGSRTDTFFDSFSTTKSNVALYLKVLLGLISLSVMLISVAGIVFYTQNNFNGTDTWKIVSLSLMTFVSLIFVIIIISQVTTLIA